MLKFFKKIFKVIMSRGFVITLLLLVQLSFIIFIAFRLWQYGLIIYIIFNILSVLASLSILNRSFNPAYKISWIMLVLSIPIAGFIFYLLFGNLKLSKNKKTRLLRLQKELKEELDKIYHDVLVPNDDIKKITKYISNITGMKVWNNTETTFLPSGEDFHKSLLEELSKAEKFIFMEYFIIREGEMWDSIKEILIEKANQGVDVRLIYDDFACVDKVGYRFKRDLVKQGIKVINFNPYRPRLTMVINYRDHRKITVIDGNVGYIGGVNLADEYINRVKRFGYWKDASLVMKGEAVWNLTLLFMQMWQYSSKDKFDYNLYRPTKLYPTNGIVQPFGDGPLDDQQTIEMCYINIISNATKYVYITTPYLVLDNELATSLKTAAQCGIDVRIMMPHIPDKKLVFMISRSYYEDLIEAGVKIYEFLPGFLHSKYIVADDKISIIGTANLDYRSFYLHFEVGALLYDTNSVYDIKTDFDKMLEVSHQVKIDECKVNWFKRAFISFLRVFSPMI